MLLGQYTELLLMNIAEEVLEQAKGHTTDSNYGYLAVTPRICFFL
jgi:hypothetical protein